MMDNSSHKTIIVIPAYNEEQMITSVVHNVIKHGYSRVIVVDDGSSDNTYQAASNAGAHVISHRINRGKGAATKTGIEAAKMLNADIVVTIDGDGQHSPADIARVTQPILSNSCDVVLGTRRKSTKQMPIPRIFTNQIANFVTWSFYGLWVSDSQSGFRAFSRLSLDFINTTADAYDYESEVVKEIKHHHLIYKEVPINVHYTDYSMSKPHRQDVSNGLKTLYKIFLKSISF